MAFTHYGREYFDDDIVGMFVNWVRTVYGKETVEENLKFVLTLWVARHARGDPTTPGDFYDDHQENAEAAYLLALLLQQEKRLQVPDLHAVISRICCTHPHGLRAEQQDVITG